MPNKCPPKRWWGDREWHWCSAQAFWRRPGLKYRSHLHHLCCHQCHHCQHRRCQHYCCQHRLCQHQLDSLPVIVSRLGVLTRVAATISKRFQLFSPLETKMNELISFIDWIGMVSIVWLRYGEHSGETIKKEEWLWTLSHFFLLPVHLNFRWCLVVMLLQQNTFVANIFHLKVVKEVSGGRGAKQLVLNYHMGALGQVLFYFVISI